MANMKNEIANYKPLKPWHMHGHGCSCLNPIPTIFDEGLSLYENVCKAFWYIDMLNKNVDALKDWLENDLNKVIEDIAKEKVDEAFEPLKEMLLEKIEQTRQELLTQIEQTRTELQASIDKVAADLNTNVETLTAAIKGNSDAITKLAQDLQTNVETLQTAINTLRNDVTAIQSTLREHGTDITDLKSAVQTNASNINTLTGTVGTHTTQIGHILSELSTLQTTIKRHNDQISALNSDVENLTDLVGDASSNVSQLAARVTKNETDIKALKTDVAENTNNISSMLTTIGKINDNISVLMERTKYLHTVQWMNFDMGYFNYAGTNSPDTSGLKSLSLADDIYPELRSGGYDGAITAPNLLAGSRILVCSRASSWNMRNVFDVPVTPQRGTYGQSFQVGFYSNPSFSYPSASQATESIAIGINIVTTYVNRAYTIAAISFFGFLNQLPVGTYDVTLVIPV